jgi:hypothetical protein
MNCPRCGTELVEGVVGRVCSSCGTVLPPTSAVAGELLRRTAESVEQSRLLDTSVRDLAGAENWDELEALLLDPAFLEAKVQAGRAFELAEDFALALE